MGIVEPKSKVVKIESISVKDLKAMHEIFVKYYENAGIDNFIDDLNKKQYVLLMRDRRSNKIVGFSTICLLDLVYKGRLVKGLFSGDTILEREYWGCRRWQLTWGLFCLKQKLLNLRTPFFWLLISKGYKTYLLLANNFINYHPRPHQPDPELENIIESYCRILYPEYYCEKRRVLDFGEKYNCLKESVADISPELRVHPKIRFFEQVNPEWYRGTELPCVGVIEVPAFFRFVGKIIKEKVARAA